MDLEKENIDGIKKINNDILVSWRSELFLIDSNATKTVFNKSINEKDFLADFEFIMIENLIVILTLLTNKIIALKLTIDQLKHESTTIN